MRAHKKKGDHGSKRIARERISILFMQAARFYQDDPAWSDRCVILARRIAMRQRVRIDYQFRRQFCHHCYRFLVPGASLRVRVHSGRVVMTCLSCHQQTRIPLRRKDGPI
ncbi:MAG: ribonuclease P [Methanomicrobiales archaeon]|nr:ribonuclease P [Methanomicrobiales archaeon]